MHILVTAIALMLACAAGFCAYLAWCSREECRSIEESLRRSVGRVAANEIALETLSAQLQKVRGKLYSLKHGEPPIEIATPFAHGLVCENWTTAQREGPLSAAAKCECSYCEAKRAERDALRSKLVPKSNTERKNAIEKGRH